MTIFADKSTFLELGLEPFTLTPHRLDHDCTICLRPLAVRPAHSETENSEGHHEAVRIGECGHVHGKMCLSTWLDCGNTCPTTGCKRMLFERKNTTNGIFESTPVLRHLAEVYGEDRVYIAMANAMGGQEIEDREMIRENERNRQKEQERSRGVSQYGNGEIDSSDEDQDFFAYESEEEENGDYMDGEGADDDVMETEDGEEMTKLTPISEEELERYAGGDDSDT